MKRSSLRAFGIAFFLIGAIIVIGEKMELPFFANENGADLEEITKLEKELSSAKKQITTLEETIAKQKSSEEVNSEQKTATETETKTGTESTSTTTDEKKKDEKDEVVTETLYIYDGLSLSDIAQKLKDLEIINNSVEMELFLAQKDYAKFIQIGQFKLNSDMSVEEIANIITGKDKDN